MKLRNAVAMLFAALAFMVLPMPAEAQLFGKNRVQWENVEWSYYENERADGRPGHFAFYIALDLDEDEVLEHIRKHVDMFERAYDNNSKGLSHEVEKRIIVVITRTHSVFESLTLAGDGHMPEGVGAYAMTRGSRLIPNRDLLLVIKADFLPDLSEAICVHELFHIFQFDMVGWQFFVEETWRIPAWVFEASAEFGARLYAPPMRDDIRRRRQRIAAANAKDTTKFPTLQLLNWGYADPYAMGGMVFEFLEAKYGREKVLGFIRTVFKDHKDTRFMSALEDLSGGEFATAELFDQAHRDYWLSQFVADSVEHQKPYGSTASFNGRQILPRPWPYRMTSPRITRDGSQIISVTNDPKYGIVIGKAPALTRDEPTYVPDPNHRDREKTRRRAHKPVRIVTKVVAPDKYEYLIAQEQVVWPFNGFDLDTWQDPVWAQKMHDAYLRLKEAQQELKVANALRPLKSRKKKNKAAYEAQKMTFKAAEAAAKERLRSARKDYETLNATPGVSFVAYFGRKNRDHAMFVSDLGTGKIVHVIELPLDQAFSPSFSPDGTTVYFSAARNTRRDIYRVPTDGSTPPVRVTTGGVFNSAPAVSPDGTKLAYIAFADRHQKVFLRDLVTNETRQLTWGAWNDNSPSWSSDSSKLAFTSDEAGGIWNLSTYDFASGTVSRWTDFFGGAYTPTFAPGENDRIILTAFVDDDQNNNRVTPNFKPFDLRLKQPLTESVALKSAAFTVEEPKTEPSSPAIDRTQLENTPVPAGWKIYDGDLVLYGNSNGGFAGYVEGEVQTILGDRKYQFLLAGSRYLKLASVGYLDESHRIGWSAKASYTEYPLVFRLSGLWGQFPAYPEPYGKSYQSTLNWTRLREKNIELTARYPFNKFNRLELGTGVRRQDYSFRFTPAEEVPEGYPPEIIETNRRHYDYFSLLNNRTNGTAYFAFVHDSVLYSYEALGPVNGRQLRGQVKVGYPLNAQAGSFMSYRLAARQYIRITANTVFATRFDGLYSSRPSGDALFFGGNDSLRNYPYYSVSCDRCALFSTELRFPLGDAYILKSIPLRLRGIVFGDVAHWKFSSETHLTARQDWSAGFGVQVWFGILPINFEWARTTYNPDSFDFNVRVGLWF